MSIRALAIAQRIARLRLGATYNKLGHHGLFADRLDARYQSATLAAGFVASTHLPARIIYNVRNRTYEPWTQRWLQRDPNATGQVVLGSLASGGQRMSGAISAIELTTLYGDGMSLYGYVGNGPVLGNDPTGLSAMQIIVDPVARGLFVSAIYAYVHKELRFANIQNPTGTGGYAGLMAGIGKAAGAAYTAWAFGDRLSPRNSVLSRIVAEGVGEGLVGYVGGAVGERMASRVGDSFALWIGNMSGSLAGSIGISAFEGDDFAAIALDAAIELGKLGLDTMKGAAAKHLLGISIGAGFYAGALEYAADTSANWWRY